MDRRAKILAAALGAFLAYVAISSFAYPRWIEPLVTIDERIAQREGELERLEEEEEKVCQAKLEYRDYLDRMGSFDERRVQNGLRERLNRLISKHKLEGANTSPSRPQTDRKTKITTMHVTVTGVGTLESAIGFLRKVSEFPHLMRVGNASISPASSSRKSKRKNLVNIRVPIEVMVLPQQRILKERFDDEDLAQPEVLVRHEDRDYSPIWTGRPFTEFVELKPLVARAGSSIQVKQGQRASLGGGGSGGDGKYTCEWSPGDGLSDVTDCTPTVDTTEPGAITYTLTVRDGRGNSDTATVVVTVTEKVPPPPDATDDEDDKPAQKTERVARWKDRKNRSICMALIHSIQDVRHQEVMVFDSKAKKTEYYTVGDDFDGGKLVYVHPRGGIVRRQDEYFLYPIGEKMSTDIKADDAGEYPVLQTLAFRVREQESVPSAKAQTEKDEQGQAPDVTPVEDTGESTASADEERAKAAAADQGPDAPASADGKAPAAKGQADRAPAAVGAASAKDSSDKSAQAAEDKAASDASKAESKKERKKKRKNRRRTPPGNQRKYRRVEEPKKP